MKRSRLNSLITEKSLRIINGADTFGLIDPVGTDPAYQDQLKNVCAKVSVQLSDEIDQIAGLLHISKRVFIEAALIQAVEQANEIMTSEGVWDALSNEYPSTPDSSLLLNEAIAEANLEFAKRGENSAETIQRLRDLGYPEKFLNKGAN